MGVPKFFRWLYERYPCLCELVREYQIPEFDNLYLDMNGIIHICSHPNDFDPQFRITEEAIFRDIFHYIEILFRMIQPQKLFFMAVDGVAPRAKLNQQRGRRFRTAKEASDLEKKARESGVEIPEQERFDSNCITPGTEFMERLHHQLRYFIANKMSNDKLWKNVKVILSGHETPGEGEHKIMDYIRYMKSQPDYDHNTRHCLYGLDADLLMLGLCTHEPHFSLLREEVKFSKKSKRTSAPEGTKFFLLHLSLLRDYLDWEFHSLKDKVPFGYDIEKIIDDWVLMGFLVGNDFIPHLPGLHIANGALQILHKVYMEMLPSLGGYINEEGTLVLSRFQRYMEKLAAIDIRQFKDEYADLKYFEGKTNRKLGSSKERPKLFEFADGIDGEPLEPDPISSNLQLKEMIQFTDTQMKELSVSDNKNEENLEQLFGGIEDYFSEEEDDDDEEEEETPSADMYQEFYQKKRDYYTNKLEFEKVTPEVLRSQAEGYVRAIQWNLNYYYNGVCSWSWYYPHHYAPYISDIKNFGDLDIKFELGKPFLPFQQLLAVLPSLSKNLLPEPFHALMVDENSPIIDYYPFNFQTDLNGKRQEWEAVVLIPFIDEERLLNAMEPLLEKLTEEEKKRNKHGPMSIYTYSEKCVEPFKVPYFPQVLNNHALEKRVMREEIYVPIEKLRKGLCSNVDMDSHYPGFPSLRHVPHKISLQKGKVKVFEYTTRGESIILEVQTALIEDWKKDTLELAKELLGHSFQVSWPHLIEAKIVEVLDSKCKKYTLKSLENSKVKGNDAGKCVYDGSLRIDHAPEWDVMLRSVNEHYNIRLGIQLGDVSVIVRALPLAGHAYKFTPKNIIVEKQWAEIPESYALQTVLKNIKVIGSRTAQNISIHELFPPKTIVFLLAGPYYGSKGQVLEILPANPGMIPRLKIALRLVPEPKMERVIAQISKSGMRYCPGGVAAMRIGISSHLLSRITGTIYISQKNGGKSTNIGLSLKFNKRRQEVPGFTKKDNVWLYSDRCIELLNNYIKKFPDLFKYLAEHTNTNEFEESEIFPEKENGMTLYSIAEWLSQQPHSKVELRTCGAEVLEEDAVCGIEKEVANNKSCVIKETKTVSLNVQPHHVFKPGFKMGHLQPDKTTKYFLYDRVVNVRESYTVPLGLRGTVVGIQRATREEDTLYDIVFDDAFAGGQEILGCTPGKGYRLPSFAMINLTHFQRSHRTNETNVKAHSQSTASGFSPGTTPLRSQNHAKNSPSLGGYRTQQDAMPDGPASAFASWRSVNVPPSPGATADRSCPELTNSVFRGKEPIILKRPPPDHSSQPPLLPPPDSTAQFQALWSELKNAGNASAKEGIKSSASYTYLGNANQPRSSEVDPNKPKDSGTDALKKLLGIDSSSSNAPLTTSPKAENSRAAPFQGQNPTTTPSEKINQPSVQEFFEKAKAASAKQQNNSVSYCVQLISLFQRSGLGIPRYDYVEVEDGKIVASLALPNHSTFHGEPSFTRIQASENAAKIALAQLSNFSEQDIKLGRMSMPANNLPAPPQQWCQPPQMQLQQHGPYSQYSNQQSWQNNSYQKLNWREHSELAPDWRRRQNTPQWHGNRPPTPFYIQQRYMQHVPYPIPPPPPHPAMQRHPMSNVKSHPMFSHQQTKPYVESGFQPGANGPAAPNTFVPLQAVRAQMSANSQHVHSPKHQKHPQASVETKSGTNLHKLSSSMPKKMSDPGKEVGGADSKMVDHVKKESVRSEETNLPMSCEKGVEGKNQVAKREDGEQKTKSREVKKGREVYVPPKVRKSRLAIKFGPTQ